MNKIKQSTQIILGPVPSALIACGDGTVANIITLAWVGVVNSSPPMISIAVRPNRHSHGIIAASGEFSVNLPTAEMVAIADGCGTLSGRDINKFEHFKLTPSIRTLKKAPTIEECPVSLECRVNHNLELESHTLFIGEVVATYVSEHIIDSKGKIDFSKAHLLGFCSGSYLETISLNLNLGYTLKSK